MTREETKQLLTEIAHLYPQFVIQNEDKTMKVDLWAEALGDYRYEDIHSALMEYTRNDNRGYSPSVGQLIELTEDPLMPKDHVYYPPEDIFDE